MLTKGLYAIEQEASECRMKCITDDDSDDWHITAVESDVCAYVCSITGQ